MTTPLDELRAALDRQLPPDAQLWLREARAAVRHDRSQIRVRFPAVGRRLGRQPLLFDQSPSSGERSPWTTGQAGRALLLAELGEAVVEELDELYRYGDADEQRAILSALHLLPVEGRGLPLVEAALRSNDSTLLVAAMGGYGSARLSDHLFRQAVLKCVFVGVPLRLVEGLERRADPELGRMLGGYAQERVAAGRDVPDDVWEVVHRFEPGEELRAIEAETTAPEETRRVAANKALAGLAAKRARRNECASSSHTHT